MGSARPPAGILIVEDEALLVLSLRWLIDDGIHFRVTGHAARLSDAIASIDTVRPDLALVDLRLADGQNGLDVARSLRERDIPSLLMTGNPSVTPCPDIAIGCIAKPFGDADLRAALTIAVSRARGERAGTPCPASLRLY